MAAALTFLLFVSYSEKSENTLEKTGHEERMLPQEVRSVDLSRDYSFAGENLPMDNFDAVERLDRELLVNSYWHSSTVLNIKNAGRYFPVIEPILAKHGIPEDFKYLAVIESNLRNVTSPAGAKGIWQIMKATGQHYDLEINGEVDERYHIEKATHAACKLIKDYYEQFGSWTLTAAAYNMGETRMRRNLEEQQAETYYDLNMNAETSRYIFRIMAVKEILNDPEAFGFFIEQEEMYSPLEYRTVQVSETVDSWASFADEHDISYRMLKVYNPWLTSGKLTCSGKKVYEIKLPV
jgi:hypothetical protein